MSRYLLTLALFVASCVASDVIVLTDDNFDDQLKANPIMLVEFYAPWCGHCKKLAPEYETAATELKGSEVAIAKLDATAETKTGGKYQIQGYPTLKLFRDGEPSDYEGGRTSKDIVNFMKRQSGPAVKVLDSKDALDAFIPKDEKETPVVVAFAAAGGALDTFYGKFANKKRNDFTFGQVSDASLAGDEKMETIVVFKPFDEKKAVFTGELETDAVAKFIKGNSLRLVDEIGPENYRAYVDRGVPILWLFVDPAQKDATDAAINSLKEVAPAFKEDFSFVWLSGVQYKQMAQKMSLSGDKLPALATENDGGDHFPFPESDELTAAAIKAWLTKFKAGELTPVVRSEPIPAEPNDADGVRILVGDNFKDIAMDTNKDVLIEFYAPWCGHCKKLAPIYGEVAKAFSGVDTVVIAKMDATANDAPGDFKVSGFPTLKLVTANDNTIVDYNGARTKEGFMEFLKKEAKSKYDLKEGHDEL